MSTFYNERVLVLRPGTTTNRAGETVLNYAGLENAPGFPRDRVRISPVSQAEDADVDRVAASSDWRIATEPGSGDWDVLSTDWVRLPSGAIAHVSAPPAKPTDPIAGGLHHVEVDVRQVT